MIEEQKLLANWLLDNNEYYFEIALEEAKELIETNPDYYLTGQYKVKEK